MILWKKHDILYANIIFIYYNIKFDLTWKISYSLRMQMECNGYKHMCPRSIKVFYYIVKFITETFYNVILCIAKVSSLLFVLSNVFVRNIHQEDLAKSNLKKDRKLVQSPRSKWRGVRDPTILNPFTIVLAL